MTIRTLFTDERSWLAVDSNVIAAEDVQLLDDAAALMSQLTKRQAQTEVEAEQARQEAQATGYQEGYAQGLVKAQQESLSTLTDLRNQYQVRCDEQQQALVGMALTIVKKIAGAVAPEQWLIAQAREALLELPDDSQAIRLLVSPVNVEAVKAQLSVEGQNHAFNSVDIVADESLSPEGCVIETSVGTLHVDIETQIASIRDMLVAASAQTSEKAEH